MITTGSIAEVRKAVRAARWDGRRVGLVPTMGSLHEGHLSLVDAARERNADFIVVSVFVNPLQFGPSEDFARYPRDEPRDAQLLKQRRVDLLFVPSRDTLYPEGFASSVHVEGAALPLEGERRPGHFDGVATVVLKLFNIVQPDVAVFGQKDAQQCAVIRQFVRDLDVPIEIAVAPTGRETDGLAMSSRNAYLNPDQRAIAPKFHEALLAGRGAIESGGSSIQQIEDAMHESLAREPRFEIDYLRVVDPETFQPSENPDHDLLLIGAVRLGTTRLIDNIPVPRSGRGRSARS